MEKFEAITLERLNKNSDLMSLIERKIGIGRELDVWSVYGHKPESITYCFATTDLPPKQQWRFDYIYTGISLEDASVDRYMNYLIEQLAKYDDLKDMED